MTPETAPELTPGTQAQTPTPELYVSVKRAAEILGYSPSTLRKKLDDDRKAEREGRPTTGPPWKVMPDGKSIRYHVPTLLAWAASGQERGEVHYAEKIRELQKRRAGKK